MSRAFDRRAALCAQDLSFGSGIQAFTGIDFVRVADHDRQDELHVFFLVDPALIELQATPGTPMATVGAAVPLSAVTITGAEPGYASAPVDVGSAVWQSEAGTGRTYLQIGLTGPGDFSDYALALDLPALDTQFARSTFSFKSSCPSDFDCLPVSDCPRPPGDTVDIDYLARDFESFRSAVLSFLMQRFPLWREKIVADTGMMLLELLCALADEFAYMQDRISRENTLSTAREPRSRLNHARLLDYEPDMGGNARGHVALTLRPTMMTNLATDPLPPRPALAFGAETQSGAVLSFQADIPDMPDPVTGWDLYWMNSAWNRLFLDIADTAQPCLDRGATQLTLAPMEPVRVGEDYLSPLMGRIDPDGSRRGLSTPQDPLADEEIFWVGRTMILVMDPQDRSRPHRRWQTVIEKVVLERDALRSAQLGVNYWLTHIVWSADAPLPDSFDKAESHVHLNTLEVMAGDVVETAFRVGEMPVGSAAVNAPAAIFRQAPCAAGDTERPQIVRFGLDRTVRGGLAFDRFGRADITLRQYDGLEPGSDLIESWDYIANLQEADGREAFFSVEPGFWTTIQTFERWDGTRTHRFERGDYASPHGFSLLFGDGRTGRQPEDGTAFRVRYRLNPGAEGNIAPDTLTQLGDPATAHPAILAVTNPLAFRGGRDPESADSIRRNAPQAFRAFPRRAVRNADYAEILGRLDAFQQVGAQQRWTGSWLTRFVTADPRGAQTLSEPRKDLLYAGANAVRLAGRHVAVTDPAYRAIALKIFVCVEDGAYFGDVRAALDAPLRTFFDPDNFTFGQALIRSELEALIQSVPGVRGVDSLWVRPRIGARFQRFAADALTLGPNEILVLKNDPRLPHLGSYGVHDHAVFDSVMAGLLAEDAA